MPKDTFNPSEVFTDEMVSMMRYYLAKGEVERAIRLFRDVIPDGHFQAFARDVRRGYAASLEREMTEREIAAVSTRLSLSTRTLAQSINSTMRVFSTRVLEGMYTGANWLPSDQWIAIREAAMAQFESYTHGALSNTPTEVLSEIRSIQREWIRRNAGSTEALANKTLDEAEREFRARLRKQFKGAYQAIEDGKVIRSRTVRGADGKPTCYSFTMDEYLDVSVRPTILNIDRVANETAAHIHGEAVMEYYVRDTRGAHEEREVCKEILAKSIHGRHLLALTAEAGRALGIMTIQRAKERGAMFIHCRHSVRRLPRAYLDQLTKALFVKGSSTQPAS
jgi:hypothetical protein